MDQKLFKVQGNAQIPRLEQYDARKAQQISTKIKDYDHPVYVDDSLLGVSLSLPEKRNFERMGRCSPKMMCFLLSYIYNFDLLSDNPALPYFIMLQLLNGVCVTYDDYNEILRGRRRKVEHNRIVLVIYINEKWVAATFTLNENTLYIMDPTCQDETAIKRGVNELGQKKFKSRYTIQETEYMSENMKDTDGSEIIVNSLYSYLVLGFNVQSIKLPAFKDQSRVRILAVIDQLKFLAETQVFLEQGKKLGAKANPHLPLLESFDEVYFKDQQKRFQSLQQDPYVTDQQLSIKLSRGDVVLFQKTGKSTPELMVFFLNYIYNNDLFSKIPDYTYFVIYKPEGNTYVKDELLNPLLKARRRKLDHLYVIFLVPLDGRWTMSMFHLEKKKLWIVDTNTKKVNANDMKTTFTDIGVKLLRYKYDVKNFQYLNNPYENSADGSEFLINFLYAHLCQEKSPETITFTNVEKDLMRSKLLWLMHTIYEIENPKYEDTISKALNSYKAPVQKKNSTQQNQRSSQPQAQEPTKKNIELKQSEPKILITSEPIASSKQIPSSSKQAPPSFKQIPDNSARNSKPQVTADEQQSEQPQQKRTLLVRNTIFNETPKQATQSQFAPDRSVNEGYRSIEQETKQDFKPKAILKKQNPQQQLQEPQKSSFYISDPANGFQQTAHRQRQLTQQQQDVSQDDLSIFLKSPSPQVKSKLNTTYMNDSDYGSVPKMMVTPSPVPSFNNNGEQPQIHSRNHKDALDRIQSNLLNYLNDISTKPFVSDQSRLKEISKLNDQIQNVLKIRRSFDLQEYVENSEIKDPKRQFIDVDDYRVANNLNKFLDANIRSPTRLDRSIQSVLQESFDISLRGPSSISQGILQDSKIIADRYGIQLRSPDVQSFQRSMRVAPNVMNFLLGYIQEKLIYHLFKTPNQGFLYQSTVKIFPLNFYSSLTQSSLTNTSSIDYVEASRFTQEHTGRKQLISQSTGLGRTLFDTHDWLVVPIMELPCEYSLVIVNLKVHEMYLFQLSSQSIRLQDPLFKDAYKNPYLRNVQTFLQREEKIKTIVMKDSYYQMFFGVINKDPNFNFKFSYDYSGLYTLYVVIHLVKYSSLVDVSVMEYQMKTLCQTLYDLIGKIGPNPSQKLTTLFEEKKWPF